MLGERVSIDVEEHECLGKYTREIGTVIGVDLKNGIITVQFEDGQILFFSPLDVRTIEK